MSELSEESTEGLDAVEAFMKGDRKGFRVHVPEQIDVASIRRELKMTQSSFCRTFGFSLDTVKHSEGGRRTPEAAARAFLTVISRDPQAVIAALHREPGAGNKPAPTGKR